MVDKSGESVICFIGLVGGLLCKLLQNVDGEAVCYFSLPCTSGYAGFATKKERLAGCLC